MGEPMNVESILKSLINELAAVEHERWSHWQRYMHSKGVRQADGSLILPSELVDRWERQAVTDYHSLPETEQESDREQVNRYLPIIAAALGAKL
jgi:hypothetical protein